jgi:hypothetical protein
MFGRKYGTREAVLERLAAACFAELESKLLQRRGRPRP